MTDVMNTESLEEVLAAIYDSEISCEIISDWDAGYTLKVGGAHWAGEDSWARKGHVDRISEAAAWFRENTIEVFPMDYFTRWALGLTVSVDDLGELDTDGLKRWVWDGWVVGAGHGPSRRMETLVDLIRQVREANVDDDLPTNPFGESPALVNGRIEAWEFDPNRRGIDDARVVVSVPA